MPYNAWFQCFRGCGGRHPLTEIIYECPTCGGLLEVHHDMDALRTKSPVYWRQLFDRRYMREMGLRTDIGLIIRTGFCVLARTGS